MVFLIQNTQNGGASAVQLKLDELIRASSSARNRLLTLEDLTEEELDRIKASFIRIAARGAGEEDLKLAGAEFPSRRRSNFRFAPGKRQRLHSTGSVKLTPKPPSIANRLSIDARPRLSEHRNPSSAIQVALPTELPPAFAPAY